MPDQINVGSYPDVTNGHSCAPLAFCIDLETLFGWSRTYLPASDSFSMPLHLNFAEPNQAISCQSKRSVQTMQVKASSQSWASVVDRNH